MAPREPVLRPQAFLPGEVHRIDDLELGKPRWCIIVSREPLNRGSSVVVVYVTTQRLTERWDLPNCVPFRRGEAGFERDCVAIAESITMLPIEELDWSTSVGCLDTAQMRRLIRAIGYMMSATCEQIVAEEQPHPDPQPEGEG